MNIVFACSGEYIKFVSVVIMSILNYKQTNDEIDFTIITSNDLSEELKHKIKLFESEIQKQYIYKIKISLFYVNENDYNKYSNHFIKHSANYWRLKLGDALDDSVKKCLFLGADVLVLSDLKELFDTDMQGKTVAMAPDRFNYKGYVRKMCSLTSKEDFIFPYPEFYSNDDVMLIDLDSWRSRGIEAKCLSMLQAYEPVFAEQDILNAVLGNDIFEISAKWNFWIGGHFVLPRLGKSKISFGDESLQPYWKYTRQEFEDMKNDLKIVHFTHHCRKPWEDSYSQIDKQFRYIQYPYYNKWWEIAKNTPIFSEELMSIYSNIENNKLNSYQKSVVANFEAYNKYWLEEQNKYKKFSEEIKSKLEISENNNKILQETINSNEKQREILEIAKLKQEHVLNECKIKEIELDISIKKLQLQEKQKIIKFKFDKIIDHSAKDRICNHLSYQLGQAALVNSKTLLGWIRMPFVFSYLRDKHKRDQKKYKEAIKNNSLTPLPSLEVYPDYKEALKIKKYFSYQLGQALIKAHSSWYKGGYFKLIFEIIKLKKQRNKV
ncbi:glycosyltransferase family 8 protein [Campylobacter lari]|uniref:Glycosyltransferase family 8 protein n=1 Tax=Campylobacter lari TaxID=201 RepID=A0A825SK74_CAMLA|nr:glycosyltransferase family 8 protein [Campylobacter lari]EAK0451501.1 glycosyltransferase family 8 protein [Campylobacter lari]MCW0226702.1 glycosyltransferase family 8 protein [Campylobacter lari]MCW0242502.1 glycosyltransferase family 8 protein [Campylobacter lari]MCW0254451.1 glycosyltransferase family 8 protein [Campylobacter lari]